MRRTKKKKESHLGDEKGRSREGGAACRRGEVEAYPRTGKDPDLRKRGANSNWERNMRRDAL